MNITNRVFHDCQQGSDEWLSLRAQFFTASEAPAMLGVSKYQTRSDLLKRAATGIAAEVDVGTQRRFDAGHEAEAAARPLVEGIIEDQLFPVTMTAEVDGLDLLASMDGLTMLGATGWETKLLNQDLRIAVESGELPEHYTVQMEQQLMVSGADRIFFTTTDGTHENTFGTWYESDPALRERIVAGWKQFQIDVGNYAPAEQSAPAPAGHAPEALPALRIEVTGMVTASNLDAFKAHAMTVFDGIKTELQTDADFADAEQTVKWCKEVEDKLDAAKQHALSQTASIDELFRVIDGIKETARQKRLTLDKLVKSEKEARKMQIVMQAQQAIDDHIAKLSERIGVDRHTIKVGGYGFGEAVKGLKSLDSMRDKVNAALANAKIEANAIADRIDANRKTVDDMSLLPDFASVCTKAPEDFAALLAMRKQQRAEAEAKRLDAERERIRAEEEAKAQRAAREAQAQAKAQAEIDLQAAAVRAAEQAKAAAKPAAPTGATLTLGQINAAIAPVKIDAAGLAMLGIESVGRDRSAVLYRAGEIGAICAALIDHLSSINASARKAAQTPILRRHAAGRG